MGIIFNKPIGSKIFYKCMACHNHLDGTPDDELPNATHRMITYNKNKYINRGCQCRGTFYTLEGSGIRTRKKCENCLENERLWLEESEQRYDSIVGTNLEPFLDWRQEDRFDDEKYYFYSCSNCLETIPKIKNRFIYDPNGYYYYHKKTY